MEIIKNNELIISDELNANTFNKQRTIIVKKDNPFNENKQTYLGDFLHALPNGLIYKDETGMGATHLELHTLRNSIIVEPIKVTASSKANHPKYKYVGGPTNIHPKNVSTASIIEYLKDDSIPIKKIIVVADSLWKVMKALEVVNHLDFFFLIDEVDSFQLDSTFRRSMEECIDVYKTINSNKRALLSATVMEFSDPILKEEPITIIKYDTPIVRRIDVVISHNLGIAGSVLTKIKEIALKYPTDKIFVAYNSVSNCFNLAQELLDQHYFRSEEISILCSIARKESVGVFFKELESDQLPSRICFFTSAYFTGFDLNEKYHLITVSSVFNVVHALSEKRIKQIAGRCRVGLLSETVINDYNKETEKPIKVEACLLTAETELNVLKCIKRQFANNNLLKDNYDRIGNLILDTLEYEGKRFLRNSNTVNPSISYFNIDAAVEKSYVINVLYQDPVNLALKLDEEGHVIAVYFDDQNTIEVQKANPEKQVRINKVNEILDLIRNTSTRIGIIAMKGQNKGLNNIQLKIFNFYFDMYDYIEKEDLINQLHDVALSRDDRALNNLILGANFLIDAPGQLFKSRVLRYIKINKAYSEEELVRIWQLIFEELNMRNKKISPTNAKKLTKVLFNAPKDRDSHLFKIKGLNPYNIKVVAYKTEDADVAATIGLLNAFTTT